MARLSDNRRPTVALTDEPGAEPAIEVALLRRRRINELFGVGGRSLGIICMLIGCLSHPAAGQPALGPLTLAQAAILTSLLLAVAATLSAVALRDLAARRYRALSAVQVVVDTIMALVGVAAMDTIGDLESWPLLATPILAATTRFQLGAALMTCAAVVAGHLATSIWQTGGDPYLWAGQFGFAASILVMIALISGSQARAYVAQLAELQRVRAQLHHQASHDPLTGLANRTLLGVYADQVRAAGRALAALVLDLNDFKQINDTLGHAAGDELLRVVAQRLRSCLREGDLLARTGGDEFVVLLADGDADLATAVASRMATAFIDPIRLGDETVLARASIGTAAAPAGTHLDDLLASADAAMYRDKFAAKGARSPRPHRDAA